MAAVTNKKNITCPACLEKTEWEGNPYRPFCSERCSLIDLGKWSDERYAIADRNSTGTAHDRSDSTGEGEEEE